MKKYNSIGLKYVIILNSAQSEEVWLGHNHFYIYMEVTSYTYWRTGVRGSLPLKKSLKLKDKIVSPAFSNTL